LIHVKARADARSLHSRSMSATDERGERRLGNAEIADVLEEIGDLLELEGENQFRIRAYRNAARLVRGLRTPVADMIARGDDLARLPGIGADLAAKVAGIAATGTLPLLAELRRKTPPGLIELLRLPMLGPKRVKLLADALRIRSLADLRDACAAGRLRGVAGFGPKTIARLAEALAAPQAGARRVARAAVVPVANDLVAYLEAAPGVEDAVAAGSYRRERETVGDLDIVVAAMPGSPVMDRFVTFPEVREVVAHGPTRATVVLRSGLQVDLRVVPPRSLGAALVYFTGSKAHNIALRRLGLARKLKINEYGVFRGARRIAGDTEESVYRAVGLPWIPPQKREDAGELPTPATAPRRRRVDRVPQRPGGPR
jgi:DNA polymerase (family 10)